MFKVDVQRRELNKKSRFFSDFLVNLFLNKQTYKHINMKQYITKAGLEKLKNKLEKLEIFERKKVADKLEKAASFGDLSDNAQYQEARVEKGFLESKIKQIRNMIATAIVVESKANKDVVHIGSNVCVDIQGDKQKFEIVGINEADPLNGKISYESPLGKVLMKKRKGDAVNLETPKGKTIVKILSVE